MHNLDFRDVKNSFLNNGFHVIPSEYNNSNHKFTRLLNQLRLEAENTIQSKQESSDYPGGHIKVIDQISIKNSIHRNSFYEYHKYCLDLMKKIKFKNYSLQAIYRVKL